MKVLIAAIHHWHSPFQVGTHAIARQFLERGWEVAYVSAPLTPLHLINRRHRDLEPRRRNHALGGERDFDGRLWHYVPASLVAPDNKPLLSAALVLKNWFRASHPNVIDMVGSAGFMNVDLLFLDSIYQSFWLERICYRRSAYRVADNNAGFDGYGSGTREIEELIARSVDRVFIAGESMRRLIEEMNPRSVELLANGVNLDRFAGPMPEKPQEYHYIPPPIAIYVGAFGPWFDFDLVRACADELPEVSFVLIGPENEAVGSLAGRTNVHYLGTKSSCEIPAYLRYARVGIIPFNVTAYPGLVNHINPLKLYEYAASGLAVVSTDWEELGHLPIHIRRCRGGHAFVRGLSEAVRSDQCGVSDPEALKEMDWSQRVAGLMEWAERREPAT